MNCIARLAVALARAGELSRAARLLGAASAAEERLGLPIEPFDRAEFDAFRARVDELEEFGTGKR
jgi:hypothetical protein